MRSGRPFGESSSLLRSIERSNCSLWPAFCVGTCLCPAAYPIRKAKTTATPTTRIRILKRCLLRFRAFPHDSEESLNCVRSDDEWIRLTALTRFHGLQFRNSRIHIGMIGKKYVDSGFADHFLHALCRIRITLEVGCRTLEIESGPAP